MRDSNRPDIPALESIRCGNVTFYSIAAVIWLLPATTILWGIIYLAYLYITVDFASRTESIAGLILSIFLVAWFYPKSLLPYLRWETNSDGILFQGLFRRRFISWTEINHVSTESRRLYGVYHQLKTSRDSIRVPVEVCGSEVNAALSASIYQHLNRQDKADGMKLGKEAESFWIPVPESVPVDVEQNVRYELDWHNLQSVDMWRTRIADIAVIVLLTFAAWFLLRGGIYFIYFCLCGLAIGIVVAFRPSVSAPRRFILRSGRFEVYTIRQKTLTIPWSNVKRVGWSLGVLWMKCENPKITISIPYAQNRASAELALAIVRKLREFDHLQPLSIPHRVFQWYEGRQDEESVIV